MNAASTGILMGLFVTGSVVRADSPASHDFTNLQRLAAALKTFTTPESANNCITFWRQEGPNGVSFTRPVDAMDLMNAVHLWADACKDHDLENVAVIQADGKTIRFVDVKDRVSSKKPSGVILKRGDLVVVLKQPAK